MIASTDLIIYPHCPKTGGTTLKERYRHDNKEFLVADDDPHARDYTKVIFGHSVEIGFWENDFTDKNIIYVTCLRDPVKRMMSMYNFFKTQLFYMRPDSPDVDFYLWYVNKDVLRPMLITKQYEYYLHQFPGCNDLRKSTEAIYNIYKNSVLEWDVKADTSSVNQDRVAKHQLVKDEIEEWNMELTWKHVMQKFDHVLFQDTNIVSEFDKLLDQYNMNLKPWTDMTETNETAYDLSKSGYGYTEFEDIQSDLQAMVLTDLKHDIEFYNRCANKWKR